MGEFQKRIKELMKTVYRPSFGEPEKWSRNPHPNEIFKIIDEAKQELRKKAFIQVVDSWEITNMPKDKQLRRYISIPLEVWEKWFGK